MYSYFLFIGTYNEGEKWRTEVSDEVRLISQLNRLTTTHFPNAFSILVSISRLLYRVGVVSEGIICDQRSCLCLKKRIKKNK
jgi:hypothetical protein